MENLTDLEVFDLLGDEIDYSMRSLNNYADEKIAESNKMLKPEDKIGYLHDCLSKISEDYYHSLNNEAISFIISKIKNEIERLINIQSLNLTTPTPMSNPPKVQKTITGFYTNLTTEQIVELYNKLQGNYIDCSLGAWKVIFDKNKIVEKHSIKWLDSKTITFRLLAYLIQEVFYDTKDNEAKIEWQKFSYIFKTRNLKGELSKNPHPKGAVKIDEILRQLLIK